MVNIRIWLYVLEIKKLRIEKERKIIKQSKKKKNTTKLSLRNPRSSLFPFYI